MKIEPFAMERWQSVFENQVDINLSESGVHPLSVRELVPDEDVLGTILDEALLYPQTNGTEQLRTAIAALHPDADAANVEVTNGGSEANYVACWSLLDPADEVVVMTPVYGQIPALARAYAGAVHEWPLIEQRTSRRFALDLDRLVSLVNARTKLIAICNPNNPTGLRLSVDELDAIGRIADAHGAWVLSDEVYRGAELDAAETSTMWGRAARVVVTGGLSKAYGLPGLRIGWAVASAAAIESFWSHHDYTSIAPGFVSDRLARVAFERRSEILARTRALLNDRYPIVREWAAKLGDHCALFAPDAGAIACVRYEHALSSTKLCERLRVEQDLLTVPGDHFGMGRFLRVGFGGPKDELIEGLRRVATLLNE